MARMTDMRQGEAGQGFAAKFPGWIALTMGLAVMLSTVAMVVKTHNPIPIWDQWDDLVTEYGIDWNWLIAQHNEHRLLFPRLVFILDYVLTHENNSVDLTVNILLVGCTFVMLAGLARRGGLMASKRQALWCSGLLLGFLFSAIQEENFTWGYQVQFFGICTLAVATLSVMVLARPTLIAVAAVVILEAVALYTLSSGIVIMLLTIGLALWLRRPISHVLVLGLAGATLLASYLFGYQTPDAHSDPLRSASHIGLIVKYALTELGLPLWSLSFLHYPMLSAVLGGFGLAIFFGFGAVAWRRRQAPRLDETVWLALAAFAVVVAFLTGVGRSRLGIPQALSSRYATPMILFWLALSMLTALAANRQGARARGAVLVAGLVLLALIVVNQPRFIERALREDASRRASIPAVLAEVADVAMLARLYPTLEGTMNRIPGLKRDHASVFADPWADRLGESMRGMVGTETLPACPGDVETVLALEDADHPGWRAVGHLRLDAMPGLSDRLVFLDGGQKVIGYGLAGFYAHTIDADPKHADDRQDWWIGAFQRGAVPAVTAYALGLDDKPACGFGTLTPGR